MASIKPRQQILQDLIDEAKRQPDGWKATIGTHPQHHSQDYYVYHPKRGLYVLKEFDKNPFTQKGIGCKVARRLDDDIDDVLAQSKGNFGIIQGELSRILHHMKQGYSPKHILEEGLQGGDMGIRIPLKGSASTDTSTFTTVRKALSSKQSKLDEQFEQLLDEDGLTNSYR